MNSVKEMVESTLIRSVSARNSDNALYDAILITHGFEVIYEYGLVGFVSTMQRWRRYFQERGMYEAKKDVKEKRQSHSKWWKSEMLSGQKKKTQEINLRKKMR